MSEELQGKIEPVTPEDPTEDELNRKYPTRRRKCNVCKQYPDLLYKEIGENYTRLYLYNCKCITNVGCTLRWDPVQVNAFHNWIELEPYRIYIPE